MSSTPSAFSLSDDSVRVDWDLLVDIFRRAPLGTREPARLRQTFEQSTVRCFAWHGTQLIGAGRAISDRITYAAIFDVVVAPEHQGTGVGKAIMQHLMQAAEAPNILLHATPGKEGFYSKLGFRKMKTAMGRFAFPEVQERWGYIE